MKKLLAGLVTLLAAVAATLYFYPPALMASARLVETHLAGLSSQVVTAGELDFAYYDGGPKLGETIVMVHGFGADKDNWLRMARHFSGRYHVVVPDLPGFGESSRPAGSYDVGTQAERLADFIQALGVGKVHLVGNSMGGHIVALYAARYPDRVRSLALFDNAGVTAPHKSELFDLLEQGRPNPLVVTRVSDYDRLMDFVFVDPPILPAPLKRYLADRAIANQAHYEAVFQQLVQRYIPLEPELPKIQAPTLLLWGDKDRVLDVSSLDVMKPLIPHTSTVVMKDCGHAPMIERPAETARHYQAFLDGLATGTATP